MSTMEAELVASALAMKEAVFCSNMLTERRFGKDFAKVPLYCDNTATLHALGNRSFSSRAKHIALRFFFIRELVSEGRISIHFIPTDINPADIGTKHLNKHRFRNLLDIISDFNVNDFINSQFNLVVLYACVFVLNLFCLCESTCSFCNRHSASHHHWLNEPCRIGSHGSLVCAVAGTL